MHINLPVLPSVFGRKYTCYAVSSRSEDEANVGDCVSAWVFLVNYTVLLTFALKLSFVLTFKAIQYYSLGVHNGLHSN